MEDASESVPPMDTRLRELRYGGLLIYVPLQFHIAWQNALSVVRGLRSEYVVYCVLNYEEFHQAYWRY